MDRRTKIIVSVVGIFIVLLALVGITYAYFLTQVQGNTNDTSISITTANLRLVYRDGSANIEAINIQPGDTVYTKTFTVTNEGNASIDYEVYLENVINKFVHDEDLLMFVTCSSNIVGNTCNGYGNGSVSGNTPTFGDSIYPTVNSLLIENSISPTSAGVAAEVHTYTLYLKFKDDDTDQSIDMGKTLQGKIQIYDPKDVVAITGTVEGYDSSYYLELHSDPKTSEIASDGSYIFYGVGTEEHTIYVKKRNSDGTISDIGNSTINVTKGNEASVNGDASSIVITNDADKVTVNVTIPSSKDTITLTGVKINDIPFEENTLAYKIIEKAKSNIEGHAIYSKNPLSVPAIDSNGIDEKTLSEEADDYTAKTRINSFYFRGNVEDNYVNFAGMCWRIVRIQGDGSVKLILEDMYAECNDNETEITSEVYTGNWSDESYYEYGYDENYNVDFLNYSGGLADSLKLFQTYNLTAADLQKLKIDEWCYDESVILTDAYE